MIQVDIAEPNYDQYDCRLGYMHGTKGRMHTVTTARNIMDYSDQKCPAEKLAICASISIPLDYALEVRILPELGDIDESFQQPEIGVF